MTITQYDLDNYIATLRNVNQTAADKIIAYINKYGLSDTKQLLDYSYSIVATYAEAAGAWAAEMYDAVALLEGKYLPPAEIADIATYGDVAKAINGTLKVSENAEEIASAATRWVKMASADTMLNNAIRDGAQFAWVPHGDTCPFCITLASRGWQNASKKALKGGHAEHIHSNCDCQYTIRFDKNTNVEGYDPDKYLSMYRNAEGSTPQERINSMRRIQYEQNQTTYLRNNLPRGFVDERSVGKPISEKDLNDIRNIADLNGIQLGRDGNNIEFDTYCGDPQVLRNVLDELISTKEQLGLSRLTLEYDNVLGYEGDNSKIDIGAFAESFGNTIKLNKFMFDDSEYLVNQYVEAVKDHIFAPGTSYINIVDHELGHIYENRNPGEYQRIIRILQSEAVDANITLRQYIRQKISIYASSQTSEGEFNELIPELESMFHGNNPDFANHLLLGR